MISMPVASAGPITAPHYFYEHLNTIEVRQQPPALNLWYTAFDEVDVSAIYIGLNQNNVEAAPKNVEVRFTVDGVVYQHTYNIPAAAERWLYRVNTIATGPDHGMAIDTVIRLAAYTDNWHGQAFKAEVRITSALGTNQLLLCRFTIERELVT